MKIRASIWAMLPFFLLACSHGPPPHLGYWSITEGERGSDDLVLHIRQDSVALFEGSASPCDTFYHRTFNGPIIRSVVTEEVTILTVSLDDDTLELIVRPLGHRPTLSFDGVWMEARRVEGISIWEEPMEEDVVKGLRWSVAESFLQIERQTTTLISMSEISTDAQNLLLYIDSLRSDLLSGYGLVYSDEQCWWKLEVLGTWRQNTKYMIGDDPGIPRTGRFTADELHGRLLNYLDQAQLEVDVITIFPEYANALDWIRDAHGMPVTWIAGKFYNVTLGATLAELHRIKLGIVQLERLRYMCD